MGAGPEGQPDPARDRNPGEAVATTNEGRHAVDEPSNFQNLRLTASFIATGATILLCTALNHFSPSLTDPSSLLLAFHHRCGWALIGTSTWAALESFPYLTRSSLKATSL